MPVLLTMGRGTGHGGSQIKNEVSALCIFVLADVHMTSPTFEFEP